MNRSEALEKAANLMRQYNLGPSEYHAAATFEVDEFRQTFIELEHGKEKLDCVMQHNLYELYYWKVRHFNNKDVNHAYIAFAPDGTPYCFKEIISELTPGNNISTDKARKIAEHIATEWRINFDVYKQLEASQETQPSGRIDHTFVYERTDEDLKDGKYRLKIVIAGDKPIELSHDIFIPESFTRTYNQMRSINNTIAFTAQLAMNILYLLGGCIIGLLFLYRKHYLLLKPALCWGIIFALGTILYQLNNLPLSWMYYSTIFSFNSYLVSYAFTSVMSALSTGSLMTLIFAAADGLSRMAFPSHVQFNKAWNSDVARSYTIQLQSVVGTLCVPVLLLLSTLFYFSATHYLGWWMPSASLTDPNALATYIPALNPIIQSFFAGFREESLFRAIPLAGAALIGRYFKRENLFIAIAFILQVLIFGAAHANYPMQPAYARIIELILPSTIFGLLYLKWGLLPGIICHVLFDAVLMGLPIFVSTASGSWMWQASLVITMLIPLIVVFYKVLTKGSSSLSELYYNSAWNPQPSSTEKHDNHRYYIPYTVPSKYYYAIIVITLISILPSLLPEHISFPSRLSVSRTQAIEIARKTLHENGIMLDNSWHTLARAQTTEQYNYETRYIWNNAPLLYQKLLADQYIRPPFWHIRFARFDGDIIERAREYAVDIFDHGAIMRIMHRLPESDASLSLSVDQARTIAHDALRKQEIIPEDLQEISAVETQQPARKDWTFTFANTKQYQLSSSLNNNSPETEKIDHSDVSEAQARILVTIAGDKVTDIYRHIHVPEAWTRQQQEVDTFKVYGSYIATIIQILFVLTILIAAAIRLAHNLLPIRLILYSGLALIIVFVLNSIFTLPISMSFFSTAQSLATQIFNVVSAQLLGTLLVSIACALLITYSITTPSKYVLSENNYVTKIGAFCVGIFIYISMAYIYFIYIKRGAPLIPPMPLYTYIDSYFPAYSITINLVLTYIKLTLLILSAHFILTQFVRTTWYNIIGVYLLLSCVTALRYFEYETVFALAVGSIIGIIISVLYAKIIQYDVKHIPLATAGFMIMYCLQQATYAAFPHAIAIFIATAFAILCVSLLWIMLLSRRKGKDGIIIAEELDEQIS